MMMKQKTNEHMHCGEKPKGEEGRRSVSEEGTGEEEDAKGEGMENGLKLGEEVIEMKPGDGGPVRGEPTCGGGGE